MYKLATFSLSLSVLLVCCHCQYRQQQPPPHYQQQQQQQEADHYPRTPPPAILSHKQALNHDGNFKYLFTSENGLAQGESIAPDGIGYPTNASGAPTGAAEVNKLAKELRKLQVKIVVSMDGPTETELTEEHLLEVLASPSTRHGGYSYTDPNGKKISVKYTAGKEGFKIIEANHLPKAPQPDYPLPQTDHAGPESQVDDGQYRPHLYQNYRPQPQSTYTKPVYQQPAQAYHQPAPVYHQPQQYVQAKPQYAQLTASPAPITNQLDEREPEYNDEPGKPNSFGSGYIFEFKG